MTPGQRLWWRHALPGAAATALLSLGGVGVGAVPYPYDSLAEQLGIAWLHTNAAGRAAAMACCAAALTLLLAAWWRLRGACAALGARGTAGVVAAWVLPMLVAPPLFSRDVYAYAGQGHLVTVGLDPYSLGPYYAYTPVTASVDDIWQYTASPYGPLFLWLVAHTPGVGSGAVLTSVYGLRLLAVVGLAGAGVALAFLARATGHRPHEALWLGVANPFVLVHVVGGAHNDGLMVAPVMGALALLAHRRGAAWLAAAGGLVAVGALIKAPALLALPFLPLVGARAPGWRRWTWLRRYAVEVAAGGAGCLVTVLALTAISGLGSGWLGTLTGGTSRPALLSVASGLGVLAAWATGAEPPLVESGAYAAVLAVVATVGAVAGARCLLHAPRLGAARALGWGLLAAAALAPVVQPWYLLWGLLPLAAAATARERRLLAVASTALCLTVLPDGHNLFPSPLYGAPAVFVVLVVVGVEQWRGRHLPGGGRPAPDRPEAQAVAA